MVWQFDAERDAAGFHAPLQLRQKNAASAIIAEQVISEIRRAIGAQIEGVRVTLLELAQALLSDCSAKTPELCVRLWDRHGEFNATIVDRLLN